MNTKRIKSGMVGLIFVLSGAGVFLEGSISVAQVAPMIDQRELQTDESGKTDSNKDHPVIPPTTDNEMVIKPDVPPDPDAIITPPVIDPEMAVDPRTRRPMTSEKLKQLTPEELDKDMPDHGQQRLPDR